MCADVDDVLLGGNVEATDEFFRAEKVDLGFFALPATVEADLDVDVGLDSAFEEERLSALRVDMRLARSMFIRLKFSAWLGVAGWSGFVEGAMFYSGVIFAFCL